MELKEINKRLSVTDHLSQILNDLLDAKFDSCAYKEVVHKVLDFVDDLNWDYVVQGEKEIQNQEQLSRELSAVTTTEDVNCVYKVK